MKEFIWKKFVKDYENVKNPEVRGRYTKLTGIIGILVNSVLCVIKIVMGLAISSVAVVADGAHDLADSMAACITLIGARIAGKPADKAHPYGHARVEYLASLLVSAIVLIVGFELMKTSISKCIHPVETDFSWLMIGFMLLAIVLKGSSALFTIATGRQINSLPVIAAGTDNRNDVISSIIIVIGMLIHHFTGLELDGYMGCLVSLFILYSGLELIKETIDPLLGEPPEQETIDDMHEIIMSHPEIIGVHDMVIYNYGPGKEFASFHAEVDSRGDMMEIHDVIDNIETEIFDRMKMPVTCHMDPIEVDNPIRISMQEIIAKTIMSMDGVESYHDLRVVPGRTHTNIIFDLVLEPGCKIEREEIYEKLADTIKKENDSYETVINFDNAYI
ncbi:MAG: cation diffusion facilitator family transporter [Bacillota bacterium]|nr:cation diffusion facilitator family transporter [Bacillota bacterium]